MKRTGPSTEPLGMLYNKEDGSDSRCRTETTCLRLRYDSKHARAVVSAMNIKNISQTVQQYVMTYCIECCTQIEKSRDQSVVRITTGQRIIKDMSLYSAVIDKLTEKHATNVCVQGVHKRKKIYLIFVSILYRMRSHTFHQ